MTDDVAEWSLKDSQECQQLLARLCFYLDHDRTDDMAALFAAAPAVTVFGQTLHGLGEILPRFRQLTQGIVIRHCLSPSFIEPSGHKARGHTYVTVFRAQGRLADIPLPMAGASMMAEYRNMFVREPAGWRIEDHHISMIFRTS